jgi:hypothetical protein
VSALAAVALLAVLPAGRPLPARTPACAGVSSCTLPGAASAEHLRLALALAGDASRSASQPATNVVAPDTDDLDIDPAEPDFTLIDLPTNLRLPRHRLAFRLTHRFARPLGQGDFEDLLADLFGFDGGAQVGLGLRFGLLSGSQLGIYRTSDRTIELFAQQQLLREGRWPLGVSLVGSIEGLDNFGLSEPSSPQLHQFSPAVAVLLSRKLGSHGAIYAVPSLVGHTRLSPSAPGTADGTLVLGLGLRLRLTRTMSLVGEVHPRLAGYRGDLGSGDADPKASFGVEWRVGGHAFQLNVSNAQGTTPAQVARGAQGQDGWFIGFNLSRKFY